MFTQVLGSSMATK